MFFAVCTSERAPLLFFLQFHRLLAVRSLGPRQRTGQHFLRRSGMLCLIKPFAVTLYGLPAPFALLASQILPPPPPFNTFGVQDMQPLCCFLYGQAPWVWKGFLWTPSRVTNLRSFFFRAFSFPPFRPSSLPGFLFLVLLGRLLFPSPKFAFPKALLWLLLNGPHTFWPLGRCFPNPSFAVVNRPENFSSALWLSHVILSDGFAQPFLLPPCFPP